MRLLILTIVSLLGVPLLAESPKKKAPAPTPTVAPLTLPTPAVDLPTDPDSVIQRFFDTLKGERIDQAYEGLGKNTVIAEKAENLQQLKKRTQEAIDKFGPVTGYEVVQTIQVGNSLFRQTCISLNENLPLRWRFYFYRIHDEWRIVDLRVDDGIVELFEEASRKQSR